MKTQPGGEYEYVYDVPSYAVFSDRSSAVAAASHSLFVEMRAPPQKPLSIKGGGSDADHRGGARCESESCHEREEQHRRLQLETPQQRSCSVGGGGGSLFVYAEQHYMPTEPTHALNQRRRLRRLTTCIATAEAPVDSEAPELTTTTRR